MSTLYELVIFTASVSEYANSIIDVLDSQRVIVHRLYRNHCTCANEEYIKDLSLIGRDLKSVIIIDNAPISYSLQPFNALPILSWVGDKRDSQLLYLIPILKLLKRVDDVREYLKKIIKNNKIDYKSILPAFRNNNEENLKSDTKVPNRSSLFQTKTISNDSLKEIYDPLVDKQEENVPKFNVIDDSEGFTTDISCNLDSTLKERNVQEEYRHTPKRNTIRHHAKYKKLSEKKNTIKPHHKYKYSIDNNKDESKSLLEEFHTHYEAKRKSRTIAFDSTQTNIEARNNEGERLKSKVGRYIYTTEYNTPTSQGTQVTANTYLKEKVPYKYQVNKSENESEET